MIPSTKKSQYIVLRFIHDKLSTQIISYFTALVFYNIRNLNMRYWEYRILEVLRNTFPQRTSRYTRTVHFILSVNEKYSNFHIAHTNTTIGVDRI